MRMLQCCAAAVAVAGTLCVANVAHAQQVVYVQAPPPPSQPAPAPAPAEDHARFRGGIALEGGLLLPQGVTLGAVGPVGQLGVQINNMIGVYAVPGFDILFGSAGGIDLTAAVMVDFTLLDDVLTVGGGLDSGVYAAFGQAAGAAGAQYGGRLHVAWNALVSRGADGVRRRGLVIGLDARLLVGPSASASANIQTGATSVGGSDHAFVFSPMLSVGYQAF